MELRLILGDQLNAGHSWFRTPDPCGLLPDGGAAPETWTTAATIARRCWPSLPPCASSAAAPPHPGGPPGPAT